jgi:hypothetical protein
MTDPVFLLLVAIIPLLSCALGALVCYLWLRGWIDRIRTEDYDQGWRAGREIGLLEAVPRISDHTMMVPATGPQTVTEPDPPDYLSAPLAAGPPASSPVYDQLWAELHRELADSTPLVTMAEARAETLASPAGGG